MIRRFGPRKCILMFMHIAHMHDNIKASHEVEVFQLGNVELTTLSNVFKCKPMKGGASNTVAESSLTFWESSPIMGFSQCKA